MNIARGLSLDDDAWSIGERAFARMMQRIRLHRSACKHVDARRPFRILEFGAGRSSIRIAADPIPDLFVLAIDHDAIFYRAAERLAEQFRPAVVGPDGRSRLGLHLAPLAWQIVAGAPYLTFEPMPLDTFGPEGFDVVIVDGPPWWTRRGREAALLLAWTHLRRGGLVFLDDARRPGEVAAVVSWKECLRMGHEPPIATGHHIEVFRKLEDGIGPRSAKTIEAITADAVAVHRARRFMRTETTPPPLVLHPEAFAALGIA